MRLDKPYEISTKKDKIFQILREWRSKVYRTNDPDLPLDWRLWVYGAYRKPRRRR